MRIRYLALLLAVLGFSAVAQMWTHTRDGRQLWQLTECVPADARACASGPHISWHQSSEEANEAGQRWSMRNGLRPFYIRHSGSRWVATAQAQSVYPAVGASAAINPPPVFNAAPNCNFTQGTPSSCALNVADPNNDPLTIVDNGTCSVSLASIGISLDSPNRQLTYNGSGAAQVVTGCTFNASDGVNPPVTSLPGSMTISSIPQFWSAQNAGSYVSEIADRNGNNPASPVSPVRGYAKNFGGYYNWPAQNPAIMRVGNRQDTGSESLRACIEDNSGPRVCLVEVAGLWDVGNRLNTGAPGLTVDCNTAPGPVMLKQQTTGSRSTGNLLRIQSSNVVLSGCILWLEGITSVIHDNVDITSGTDNVTLVNMTLLGGTDGVFDVLAGGGGNCTSNIKVIDTWMHNPNGHQVMGLDHDMISLMGTVNSDCIEQVLLLGTLYSNYEQRGPRALVRTLTIANHTTYNAQNAPTGYMTQCGETPQSPYVVNILDFWSIDGPNTPGSIQMLVFCGSNALHPSSDVYLARFRDHVNGFPANPWEQVRDDVGGQEASIRHNLANNLPTGFVPTDTSGLSRADHWTLSTQNLGAWPCQRSSQLQAQLDAIFAGTLAQAANPQWTPPANMARVSFNVGPNPHGDDDMDGLPNLMELLEQRRRDCYAN